MLKKDRAMDSTTAIINKDKEEEELLASTKKVKLKFNYKEL